MSTATTRRSSSSKSVVSNPLDQLGRINGKCTVWPRQVIPLGRGTLGTFQGLSGLGAMITPSAMLKGAKLVISASGKVRSVQEHNQPIRLFPGENLHLLRANDQVCLRVTMEGGEGTKAIFNLTTEDLGTVPRLEPQPLPN